MLQVKIEPPTTQNAVWIALGHGHFAIVDNFRAKELLTHKFYARKSYRKFYARTNITVNGVRTTISMHRLVANTPKGMFCHHLTPNSLDNRRCNLLNSTDEMHRDFHHIRKWIHNFKPKKR